MCHGWWPWPACWRRRFFALALTYLANMYFVRTIINPMASITEIAKRIASGYYGIQLEKTV